MIDFTKCAVNKFKGYGGANGNWEILIDEQKQYAQIAPVYDLLSCISWN